MKKITLGTSGLEVSEVSLGCMRIGGMEDVAVDNLIKTCLDEGIDFYDHANIYGGGKCEEVFAKSIARLGVDRTSIYIQSKCGIRSGFFDFSKEHILESVAGSLKRLDTDYLDVLLLHRPDTLIEPEEVAEAFQKLSEEGKVRNFGISNFNPGQIELLQAYVPMKLHANQLQFSITNTGMIDRGICSNTKFDNSVDHDGGILDYCRLKKITIQPWSPFQHGFFAGTFIDSPEYPELNKVLDDLCAHYGVTKTGMAIAWIQRHPAKMQSIAGTTNATRIKEVADAVKIDLTRPHWYEIYRAAGNLLP
jgi:predicted oxidoreductase